MPTDLHDFIARLERAGQLVRITAPVSPVLEIAAIADRVSKARAPTLPSPSARATDPRFFDRGGPALLFEHVRGSHIPLLINAFGSYRRVEIALNLDEGALESLADRIAALVNPQPPRSVTQALARAKQLAPLLRIAPKTVTNAPCHEIIHTADGIDLTTLPMLRCWPLDGDLASVGYPPHINDNIPGAGHPDSSQTDWDASYRGRYITLAGVHTIHADDRHNPKPPSHNVGMYRLQLLGKQTLALHCHVHHDGAAHYRSWQAINKPMPVAIALGAEPVLPYAATAPLPPGISELLLAGFLNKRPIPMVNCKAVPLRVPANAEIVIEGYASHLAGNPNFDPRAMDHPALAPGAVLEGPFGDHTGYYSLPDQYPVLNVTAITHKRNPIYPTTIVGLPIQEDYFLGKATERIFLPLLRTLIPDIIDYDLPLFGCFHNCAIIKIKPQYPLHARRVMHAVWGAGQMAWTKLIIVVDHTVNVHDHPAVLRAVVQRCHPRSSVEHVIGPLDILDHAAPQLAAGSKIGLDATERHPPRHQTPDNNALLERIGTLPAVKHAVTSPNTAWTHIACNARGRDLAKHLAHLPDLAGWFAIVDPDIDINDFDKVMFHLCANIDPRRDTFASPNAMIFDATTKQPDPIGEHHDAIPVRAYPPIIRTDDATNDLLDRRWHEYAIHPHPTP